MQHTPIDDALETIFPRRVAQEIAASIEFNTSGTPLYMGELRGLTVPAVFATDIARIAPRQLARLDAALRSVGSRLVR